jgi:hypothetical protein
MNYEVKSAQEANLCEAGSNSFFAYDCNYGKYINCIGQQDSFGSSNNCYNSNLCYCLLYGSEFGGGEREYCVDNL